MGASLLKIERGKRPVMGALATKPSEPRRRDAFAIRLGPLFQAKETRQGGRADPVGKCEQPMQGCELSRFGNMR
jgi:hypothetical protein